jgi:hypothetical protein
MNWNQKRMQLFIWIHTCDKSIGVIIGEPPTGDLDGERERVIVPSNKSRRRACTPKNQNQKQGK